MSMVVCGWGLSVLCRRGVLRQSTLPFFFFLLSYVCMKRHLKAGINNKTLYFYSIFPKDIYKFIKIILKTFSSPGLRTRIIFIFH